ncbi:MAG: PAS domain S-box protein [Marinilabiliales bacterium]|nr:PAS domain S-box protein [Marinilabiliales bacterium]
MLWIIDEGQEDLAQGNAQDGIWNGLLKKPLDRSQLKGMVTTILQCLEIERKYHAGANELEMLVSRRTKELELELEKRKSVERVLRKTENHYHALIEKAPGGIALIDGQGQFKYISPSARRMFGYSHDTYMKMSPDALTHPDDLPFVLEELTKVFSLTDYSPTIEYRFQSVDGSYKWIESTFSNMLADPDIEAIIINFREVNERKMAEEAIRVSELKYRALFESQVDCISIYPVKELDETVCFLDCNQSTCSILGYSRDEFLRMTPFQLESVTHQATLSQRIEQIKQTGQLDYEARVKHKNGFYLDLEVRAKLINISGIPAIMCIGRDITTRKIQEETLRQSNELNRILLGTIPYGMDIVDEEGNLLFINQSMTAQIKVDMDGKKCWEVYKDDHCKCAGCPLAEPLASGETRIFEAEGILGGRTFLISHTGMQFNGKNAILEIFQDVTEKNNVEKRVNLLAHALESISECVSITDVHNKIVYVNRSFLETYGYAEHELIGQNIKTVRYRDLSDLKEDEILPETMEGGWKGELVNQKRDGTLFNILLSTSIIRDSQQTPMALVGVATDITEMLKVRDELIHAKELAEESNHLKTAFLNNMSHEIRTPMNHIMGFSSLMAEARCEEKDAYAEIVLSSSHQLLKLIENVMLLSRLQSEKIELVPQSFKPISMIQLVIKQFEASAKARGLQLNEKIPVAGEKVSIRADLEKIKKIMKILVDNAIKYSLKGNVEVGFGLQDEELTFFVNDSGMGIPEREQSKIFDSFYRGEQAISMAIGGTGLGLSLAKELVKTLKGKFGFESTEGIGSYFYFAIPLVMEETRPLETKRTKPAKKQLSDLRVLVVDDEEINFAFLELLLKKLVASVGVAHSGIEAIEKVSEGSYDIILMDLKMPDMDGYEASRILKLNFPNIPIIVQSAYATREDRQKAILAGCDDFLPKPITKELLIELIQRHC